MKRTTSRVYMLYLLYGLSLASYSKSTPRPPDIVTCPDVGSVQATIDALRLMLLMGIIVILVFAIVFNTLGVLSQIALRLGEFFNERIRFAIELIVFYFLFFHNLDPAVIAPSEQTGCPEVNMALLLSQGPILFLLLGKALEVLGMWDLVVS